ncbi:MAG: hypothetical protein HRT35_23325 [Algicola sp.]|nr:hypothetical protein [Algicola sp.]
MIPFYCSNTTKPIDLDQRFAAMAVAPEAQTEGRINPANWDKSPNYVYVIGNINAHFPTLSIEKAFYQALQVDKLGTGNFAQVNDDVTLTQQNHSTKLKPDLYKVLSKPQNINLAREMVWTLDNLDNNEVYTLLPLSNDLLCQFIAVLNPDYQSSQVIVVGNEITVGDNTTPKVATSNLMLVSNQSVSQTAAHEQQFNNERFNELVDELLSLNTNDGYGHKDRALNYVLYQNPIIYQKSYNLSFQTNSKGANPNGFQLVNVRVMTDFSGSRIVAKVIFDYQGINSGARQSWYAAVDVTGEYPFLLVDWKRYLPQN